MPTFDYYTSQQWQFGVTQTDAEAGDTFEYNFLFNTLPENADFSFLVRPDKTMRWRSRTSPGIPAT